MQIVIDIDEDTFKRIKSNHAFYVDLYEGICAIQDGTPLPKGHGDLIDCRELKKEIYTTTEWNGDVHRIIYEASVDDAPTIIEGDNE